MASVAEAREARARCACGGTVAMAVSCRDVGDRRTATGAATSSAEVCEYSERVTAAWLEAQTARKRPWHNPGEAEHGEQLETLSNELGTR